MESGVWVVAGIRFNGIWYGVWLGIPFGIVLSLN